MSLLGPSHVTHITLCICFVMQVSVRVDDIDSTQLVVGFFGDLGEHLAFLGHSNLPQHLLLVF